MCRRIVLEKYYLAHTPIFVTVVRCHEEISAKKMFGLLVSGRLVQTNAQQVAETKWVFGIDNATEVHHMAVFLTGAAPLPANAGAIIWLGFPPFNNWRYLGYLTNQSPSAMFQVQQVRCHVTWASYSIKGQARRIHRNTELRWVSVPKSPGMSFSVKELTYKNIVAQVGIELGDIKAIEHQFGTKQQRKEKVVADRVAFGQKMVQSVFNYCASFCAEVRDNNTGKMERIVPLSVLEKWYSNFESKLKNNPDFWRG